MYMPMCALCSGLVVSRLHSRDEQLSTLLRWAMLMAQRMVEVMLGLVAHSPFVPCLQFAGNNTTIVVLVLTFPTFLIYLRKLSS